MSRLIVEVRDEETSRLLFAGTPSTAEGSIDFLEMTAGAGPSRLRCDIGDLLAEMPERRDMRGIVKVPKVWAGPANASEDTE